MTFQNTEATALSSPYPRTTVSVVKGILSVFAHDPKISPSDFEKATLLDAVLITDEGKQIPLKLWGIEHGTGVTFDFKLKDIGFDEDHFGLRITFALAGRTNTISGKFTVRSHTQMIDVIESLDHG